jgi:hypothetical protein
LGQAVGQNVRCRRSIDGCFALAIGHAGVAQRVSGCFAGQAFIPEQHRQIDMFAQPASKRAHGLGARSQGPIHVEWHSDDQPTHAFFFDDFDERANIVPELGAMDRGKWARQAPTHVAYRNADCLRPGIKTE